jgi:Mu-like prophage I protein
MGDDLRYIVPSPADATFQPVADVPVALARTRQVTGRLFEKHILSKGPLIHPVTKARIDIDDAFVSVMEDNFRASVCPIVQVPLANAKNEHVENPDANIGEVVGIKTRGDKVYALIDARDEQAAARLGKTYLGASAFLSTNYTDTRTNKKVGPTLLHVAVTNRPYVVDLDDYKEVVAASADYSGDVVVLTAAPEEPVPLTRDEMLAALKSEHGIDVEALQAAAAKDPDTAALTAASLVSALRDAGVVQLSADSSAVSLSDVTAAVVELATDNRGLRTEVDELKLARAETEVDGYISDGRLLPKTKDVAVQMALSNRDGLAAILAPADAPYVALNHQKGIDGPDGEQKREQDIDAELARLTAENPQFFTDGTRK